MSALHRTEPVAIVGLLVAIVNAVQSAAIPMPAWAHTVIAVVSIVLGTIVSRQTVAPAAPPAASEEAPGL